jgi:mono/diheme cytochrome c family protein
MKILAALVLLPVLAAAAAAQPALAADHSPGAKVYRTLCAICHQPDGSGVATMQPRLADDPVVAGDPVTLIKVLLQGPAAVLPPGRPRYQDVMPPMAGLSDRDIASVLTFVRKAFGHDAAPVTAAQVAAQRAAP